jgi:RepB DNA-primase from phage plasmid
MDSPDLDEAAAFLSVLTRSHGWDALAFFQTFDDGAKKIPDRARTFVGALRQHAAELTRLNALGACVAVAINSLRGRRRLLEEVSHVRALFIDCDGPRRRPLACATSMTVASRAGHHHYWLLREPAQPHVFSAAQRQLASYYGTDSMVCDPTRVMRLPGFDHCKAGRYRVHLVRADPAITYDLAELLDKHPVPVGEAGARINAPSKPQNGAADAFRRWAAVAPRLVGVRNATAFAMAAEGLRLGLDPQQVGADVRSYCERAGIPREAEAILRSAARYVRRRPVRLRHSSPSGAPFLRR